MHSLTVLSTSTHYTLHHRIRYRLIYASSTANNKKKRHVKEACWFEGWNLVWIICRPRRRLFYWNNFLKRLYLHTSDGYFKHSIAYLQQKLCAWPGPWTFWHYRVAYLNKYYYYYLLSLSSNHNGLAQLIGECLF